MNLLILIVLSGFNLVFASLENDDDNHKTKLKIATIRQEDLRNKEYPQKSLIVKKEVRSNYFQMLIVSDDNSCIRWKLFALSTTVEMLVRLVTHNNTKKLALHAEDLPYSREIIKILLAKFPNASWVIAAMPYSDLAKNLESLGFTTNGDKSFLTCHLTYTREAKRTLDEKEGAESLLNIIRCQTLKKLKNPNRL